MCHKNQMLLSCVFYCLLQLLTVAYGFELNHLPTKTFNHRIKRDGGIISFRPLFVYRQQQKEKQARWKLEEAEKLQHLQLQNHQNSIAEYYAKYPVKETKVDNTYRPTNPVNSSYQTASAYQNSAANQLYRELYQNYQKYYRNVYGIYPTFSSSSYLGNEDLYDNQQLYDNDYY